MRPFDFSGWIERDCVVRVRALTQHPVLIPQSLVTLVEHGGAGVMRVPCAGEPAHFFGATKNEVANDGRLFERGGPVSYDAIV